jgi:pimeloyl-ACP methyl ester carboxylesterase
MDGTIEEVFRPLPVPTHFERSPVALALRPANLRANAEDIVLLKPFLRAQAERYAELRVPVRALVSTEDTVVSPILHLPRLVQVAPDCEQIRIEGAGHQLLYTHPERVLSTIEEALGE